ncbi:uncharacterized protein LOC142985977 [Anticarsia gemmatalis]|uniref:uncharacterized protein LOC142985977 n=1 Tax=Anticarsia gemmatalis TaxID=129554 RepID=UPI003F76A683
MAQKDRPLVPGGPAIPDYGSGHGLSEVRRQGKDSIILKSGNLLYFREGDQQSQVGVGFIIHKSLVNNVVKIESVSTRVAYLILKITKRYSLKVIQVYAPTSAHSDDEVEAMYEDISRTIHSSQTYFTVVMGDFNAKLGTRCGNELKEAESPQVDLGPDGATKNEIDFIMSAKRRIFNDVSVINAVKTGSNHRMVRGTLNLNIALERSRLMKSTLRPASAYIQNPESFQLELRNRFECLSECVDVDDYSNRLAETVRVTGSKFFKTQHPKRTKKLSDPTLQLMEERRGWFCSPPVT